MTASSPKASSRSWRSVLNERKGKREIELVNHQPPVHKRGNLERDDDDRAREIQRAPISQMLRALSQDHGASTTSSDSTSRSRASPWDINAIRSVSAASSKAEVNRLRRFKQAMSNQPASRRASAVNTSIVLRYHWLGGALAQGLDRLQSAL